MTYRFNHTHIETRTVQDHGWEFRATTQKRNHYAATCSQIFFNVPSADGVHARQTLTKSISDFGIPEQLTMDGALVEIKRHTSFMDTIRRCNINHHVSHPYTRNQNPAEGGICELKQLKQQFYWLQTKVGDFWIFYWIMLCGRHIERYGQQTSTTGSHNRHYSGHYRVPWLTDGYSIEKDGGLGTHQIGRWLGVSHRVGLSMISLDLTHEQ